MKKRYAVVPLDPLFLFPKFVSMKYMNQKIQKVLGELKGKRIGCFIDNANWFYPQRELGWRVSFRKLTSLFEDCSQSLVSRIYAGTPLISNDRKKFLEFSHTVEEIGFTLITKPLKKIWIDNPKTTFQYKCNFDVEIALDVARTIDQIDCVIIGSGDSDFLEVKRFALERKKKFIVLCFEQGVSWEMRKCHRIFLEGIQSVIIQEAQKKPQHLRAGVSKTRKSIPQ